MGKLRDEKDLWHRVVGIIGGVTLFSREAVEGTADLVLDAVDRHLASRTAPPTCNKGVAGCVWSHREDGVPADRIIHEVPAAAPAAPGEPRGKCQCGHERAQHEQYKTTHWCWMCGGKCDEFTPADPTGAEPASPAAEYHATGGNPPPEVIKLVQQEYERRFPACEECGGNGWINGPVEDDARYCDACNGTGRPTGAEPGTGKP